MSRPSLRLRLTGGLLTALLAVPLACSAAAAAMPPSMTTMSSTALPDLLDRLLPAVVNITALKPAKPTGKLPQGGENMPTPTKILGSGFIVDEAGYIVTNEHVIEDTYEVKVQLNDERTYEAKVIATNLRPDIALLKIEAGRPLPSVPFGDSDKLRIGEPVIAVGNPLGLNSTVTTGVVSAVNRDINSTMADDFIQTDAAINHGNSGGPLFNLQGEVVGVNWALVGPNTGSVGLGLAIPSRDVAYLVGQYRRYGRWTPGFVGVRVQQLTPDLAEAIGLDTFQPGAVTAVWPGGPAEKAGLQEGDVIMRFDDRSFADVRALLRVMAQAEPGSTVPVDIWRAGKRMTLQIAVATWPPGSSDPVGPNVVADRGPRMRPGDLGLHLAAMAEVLPASVPGEPARRGVRITAVAANSIAADSGLSEGDVILRVQLDPVNGPDDVRRHLDALRSSGHTRAVMLVLSGDRPHWIVVPLADEKH